MTRTALQIASQLRAVLSERISDGRLVPPLPPAARDGYAALAVWIEHDMLIERLRLADVQLIPESLRLDTAPLKCPGVGYVLIDRNDWIVLARLDARDEIEVDSGISYAYPDPMLVYCGWRGRVERIMTGCINLRGTPTVERLRLSPGKFYRQAGVDEITQADADDDLLAVAQCLSRFYGTIR